MNRQDYMKAITGIKATDSLKQKILSNIKQDLNRPQLQIKEHNTSKHLLSIRKVIAVSCALSVCLLSTLVYAGVIDLSKIYKFVFNDSTGYIEQHIIPIENAIPTDTEPFGAAVTQDNTEQPIDEAKQTDAGIVSVSNGIQIKLLSAINDEKSLRIFASATDFTGNRINAETRFEHWGLDKGHGGNISVVDFNNDTGTAILLITSLGDNRQGNAKLQISGFANGMTLYNDHLKVETNLCDLIGQSSSATVLPTEDVYVRGGSFDSIRQQLFRPANILSLDNMSVRFAYTDWLTITNAGFVDGFLHIQTKTRSDNQNAWTLNLADKYGNILFTGYSYTLYTDTENWQDENSYTMYKEFVFTEINTPDRLDDVFITVEYLENSRYYEGDWQFSFMIPDKASMTVNVEKNIILNGNEVLVDTVSLSPVGVSIKLPSHHVADYRGTDQVSIIYQDDTVIPLDEAIPTGYESATLLTFEGTIIEIEKVKNIIINGEIIPVIK